MLHVGGINGFLSNGQFIYNTRSATGDSRGQMNATNYEKWVVDELTTPKLPSQSVIVLDKFPVTVSSNVRLQWAILVKVSF